MMRYDEDNISVDTTKYNEIFFYTLPPTENIYEGLNSIDKD